MFQKTRLVAIGGSFVCWLAYVISALTGQMLLVDIFSPLCATLSGLCILLVAVALPKYRIPVILIGLGPVIWTIGDIVYLLGDFGVIADGDVDTIAGPIYRFTCYAYAFGLLIFTFVQYKKSDWLRLAANGILFSVATLIVSVEAFEIQSGQKIHFENMSPAFYQRSIVAMFLIVFFLVIIAHRSSRKLSLYGLFVMVSFFLYGILDIHFIFEEAVGENPESLLADSLYLLSIVLLGMAYATSSLFHLVEVTDNEATKRSTRPGVIMAILFLLIGTTFFVTGNLEPTGFFLLLVTTLAYFLLCKTIEANDLNERLLAQKDVELVKTKEQLANVTVLDIQTGLKNRRAWIRYYEDFSNNHQGKRLVLYSIDINYYKMISTTYGNKGIDVLMIGIGRRLLGLEGAGISAFRIDTGQFIVACEDEMQDVDAARFADYLIDVLERPFDINGKIVRVTFRISAAIYPDDTDDFSNLMNCVETVRSTLNADMNVSNCFFFDSKIMPKIQREQIIKNELQDIDYDEKLQLYYQPQVLGATGEIVGMEALLRWNDDVLGYVPPLEFIPVAEKMGIMPSLGEWIIREAFIRIQEWNTQYRQNLIMGVNISPIQLQEEYFTDTVFGILRAINVPPEWINFELTAGVASNDIINSLDVIGELRKLGLGISVDDFGAGHETFENMIRFDFNKIKIAKELVDYVTTNHNAKVIVEAIVHIAKGMNLSVIAEGVETKEQVDMLLKLGCERMQGFYFGKPLPQKEFEEKWLQ